MWDRLIGGQALSGNVPYRKVVATQFQDPLLPRRRFICERTRQLSRYPVRCDKMGCKQRQQDRPVLHGIILTEKQRCALCEHETNSQSSQSRRNYQCWVDPSDSLGSSWVNQPSASSSPISAVAEPASRRARRGTARSWRRACIRYHGDFASSWEGVYTPYWPPDLPRIFLKSSSSAPRR